MAPSRREAARSLPPSVVRRSRGPARLPGDGRARSPPRRIHRHREPASRGIAGSRQRDAASYRIRLLSVATNGVPFLRNRNDKGLHAPMTNCRGGRGETLPFMVQGAKPTKNWCCGTSCQAFPVDPPGKPLSGTSRPSDGPVRTTAPIFKEFSDFSFSGSGVGLRFPKTKGAHRPLPARRVGRVRAPHRRSAAPTRRVSPARGKSGDAYTDTVAVVKGRHRCPDRGRGGHGPFGGRKEGKTAPGYPKRAAKASCSIRILTPMARRTIPPSTSATGLSRSAAPTDFPR